DGAEFLGRIDQKFSERFGDPITPFALSNGEQDGSQAVPYLGIQAGVSWLSHFGQYRVTFGYEFNQWWNSARLSDSSGYVQAQGIFLRIEFIYYPAGHRPTLFGRATTADHWPHDSKTPGRDGPIRERGLAPFV